SCCLKIAAVRCKGRCPSAYERELPPFAEKREELFGDSLPATAHFIDPDRILSNGERLLTRPGTWRIVCSTDAIQKRAWRTSMAMSPKPTSGQPNILRR